MVHEPTIKLIMLNQYNYIVSAFEFTDAARGFMIMSCAARGVKRVGQRCTYSGESRGGKSGHGSPH